jgi:hypothetical protein
MDLLCCICSCVDISNCLLDFCSSSPISTVANSAKALLSFGQTVGHKQIQIAQELHKKMYAEVTDLRKRNYLLIYFFFGFFTL